MKNSFIEYLLKNKIKLSSGKSRLYSFIIYMECLRLQNGTTIKEYISSLSNRDANLLYLSAPAALGRGTEALLTELNINDIYNYKTIKNNSIKIFDYIINNTSLNEGYFDVYMKYSKTNKLDRIIK